MLAIAWRGATEPVGVHRRLLDGVIQLPRLPGAHRITAIDNDPFAGCTTEDDRLAGFARPRRQHALAVGPGSNRHRVAGPGLCGSGADGTQGGARRTGGGVVASGRDYEFGGHCWQRGGQQ